MALEPEIQNFFEHWIAEFTRSVEMFTGETPSLTYASVPGSARKQIQDNQLAGRLWWKQQIEGEGSFLFWTGSAPDCWSAIGSAVDEKSDPRRMYLEMLGQANQGTAAVISAAFPRPLRCPDGVADDLASLDALELAEVKITFRNLELPSLLLAIQSLAVGVLRRSEEDTPAAPPPASSSEGRGDKQMSTSLAVQSPMMARLLEIRLPVSVLLGRTSITIRDVLKLSVGSVIELDRKVGDYVEVMVHGTVVARGEIVSLSGNYGVRIKEVISREDRLALQDAA